MSLTPAQLLERRKGIGASEVAAWLGLDPRRTMAECVYDKLGLLPAEPTQENDAADLGSDMEIPIARRFERKLATTLVRPEAPYVHSAGILRANLDWQMIAARPGQPPVECKWTTADVDSWGDPDDGENAVPKRVLLQVTAQMVCSESDVAYVAAALNRFGRVEFQTYEIRRNERLAKLMVERLHELWDRHVRNHKPLPDDTPAPDAEVLKRIERVPKSVTVVKDAGFAHAWAKAKAEEKKAADAAQAARGLVLMKLGTAEAMYDEDRNLLATYYATKDKQAFDMEAFTRDHPEMVAQYTVAKPGHRVLLCKIKEA